MENNIRKVQDVFKSTELWKHFASVAENKNILAIEKLIDFAAPILDRIIEHIPYLYSP
jgi:hypothetical protein